MTSELDQLAAHRFFSAQCFNRAWDLIEKPGRTAEDDDEMLHLAIVSYWHWTQRPDCTPTTRSIGLWQISRVYALRGQAENALQYARRCLAASQAEGVEPVYLGYAYEALARAEAVAGRAVEMENYLAEARRLAEVVTEAEEKQQLLADIHTIKVNDR